MGVGNAVEGGPLFVPQITRSENNNFLYDDESHTFLYIGTGNDCLMFYFYYGAGMTQSGDCVIRNISHTAVLYNTIHVPSYTVL